MARMNYAKRIKSRKGASHDREWTCNNPACKNKINVGDQYRWFKPFRSGKRVFCTSCSIPRSLTCTSLKADAMDAFDSAYDELRGLDMTGMEGSDLQSQIESCIETVAEACGGVAQQYRDVADEHFGGGGPSAEAADEMESIQSEVEGISPDIEDFKDWDSAELSEDEMAEAPDDPAEYDAWRRQEYENYLGEKRDEYVEALEGADQL